MPESLLIQMKNLHRIFTETIPEDPKIVRDFAWTVVKQLNANAEEIDSLTCRQLLADCMQLPIERPSKLYTALLSAATRVSSLYPEFRFAAFLKMWDIRYLRPEDKVYQYVNSKVFISIAERASKAFAHDLCIHTQDRNLLEDSSFVDFLLDYGCSVHSMLVTRIREAMGKDGRKYVFVTLSSPAGLEMECISAKLQPNPLRQLPEGKRHYVNIGQIYDCVFRTKAFRLPDEATPETAKESSTVVSTGYLSDERASKHFPVEIGYVEAIDMKNRLIHIYDRHSRHFVAHILRFSNEKVGDFVHFIPIIPQESLFKTAVIVRILPHPVFTLMENDASHPCTAHSTTEQTQHPSLLRDIRISAINHEKGYASWELIEKSCPITELLSPLQLSKGETSPAYVKGYLNLSVLPRMSSPASALGVQVPDVSSLAVGQKYRAIIYLKRGKDREKRPYVACIFS